MYNLKNDQSIVIKEADKDSAVVYGKKGLPDGSRKTPAL